jgi:hypothetical protein
MQFSDAFAFLLKDVTAGGSNRNLAVIPIPIFLFQLKLSEIILIQIVLLQIKLLWCIQL